MLIDWFTVAAQIVNFLVLVWLLKRFLYGPILAAVENRERRIRELSESAKQKQAQADHERAEFEEKNAAFEQARLGMLDQAKTAAEDEKLRLVESARAEVETMRETWTENLTAEQRVIRDSLARELQGEIIGIARQVLRDCSGADLEERMASLFLKRIKELDEAERSRLAAASKASGAPSIVRSSARIPAAVQQQVEEAIAGMLGTETPVRFETNATAAAGIELNVDGYRLSWTLQDYLDSLQKAAAMHLFEKEKEV